MQIEIEIKSLEREIKKIKLMHSLGKIPFEQSKKEIRALESRIKSVLEGMPAHERGIFLLRKEFGKEF